MNDQPNAGQAELTGEDSQSLQKLADAYTSVRRELGKVIVGQEQVIEQLMIAIFAQGPHPVYTRLDAE